MQLLDNKNIELIKSYLEKPARAILTLHVHPDPDSVASNLVLADVLKEYGHAVDVVSTDAVPPSMSFLDGFKEIRQLENREVAWESYDHYWALDMSTGDRHGIAAAMPKGLYIINIDHHISNQGWGTENIVDTQERYPSTCSLLYMLFKQLDIPTNKKRATLLLTGISGDTGFFMYGLSPEVLQHAAELLEAGASYEEIKKNLIGSLDVTELTFISRVLERAEIYKEALLVSIPYDIWMTYGKAPDRNDLIVYYLNKIAGTRAGILLIEEEPFTVRLEFRSRDVAFEVTALAKSLGGGGHKNAAGATLKHTSLEEAIQKVKQLLYQTS